MTEINESEDWELDQTEEDQADEATDLTYEISFYPADITLEGYKTRFDKDQLKIPRFQRNYIWDQVRASKLIESFLLGLPVPGVFLYKEKGTNKLLVVDGLQRIMTAVKFFKEKFDDNRIFKLKNISEPWNGKSFSELPESAQIQLQDTVLRATIIQQIDPKDDSSIYHIFERLNTGGVQLNAMEVRKCVYESRAFELLEELNKLDSWRKIIGKSKPDPRMKDAELILRCLAMAENVEGYEKPMKSFLNDYMSRKKRLNEEETDSYIEQTRNLFGRACEIILAQLGEKPFHLRGRLNYAVMDTVYATVLRNIDSDFTGLDNRYKELVSDETFIELATANTSDEAVVKARFEMASMLVT